MCDVQVAAAVSALATADVESADRERVGELFALLRRVRGFVDATELRLARRSSELAEAGASESAASVLIDAAGRSGRHARDVCDRDRQCRDMPGLEAALASGAVSTDHLDTLTRLSKRLDDDTRAALSARADELVAAAQAEYVSVFERRCKSIIDELRGERVDTDAAAELERQRAASKVSRWVDKTTGMHTTLVELDPERDAIWWTAIDAQLAALRHHDTNTQTPFTQLQVDAIVTVTCGGDAAARVPEVSVLIDYQTLVDGIHATSVHETASGTELPVATLRRMCCDATIIPIVLGGDGIPLDVGRERRTATRTQRRALRAMYRSCAHPHCTVPFTMCRIHHIRWWRHLGATNIDNLLPLCERHHHMVHEDHWTLTMTPDRTATWTRPDGTHWHTGPTTNTPSAAADTNPQPNTGPTRKTTRTQHRQPALC